MPLRTLMRFLANNEELVRRISESYPVRRAAQLTVSILYRSKDKLGNLGPNRIRLVMAVLRRFQSNLKEGIEDAKKQMRK